MQFLNPGTDITSKCLGEGYSSRQITTIYGPAASGKTTCCLLASILCTKNKFKTVYLDTENGFNLKRLRQLTSSNILDNLLLVKVTSFHDQLAKIRQCAELAKNDKLKLFIVDTIGSLYRTELNKDPVKINSILVEQFRILTHIAREHDKIVLLTNQVYERMDKKIVPVSGDLIKRFSDVMILLDKTHHNNRYIQRIKPEQEERYLFEIREKGMFLI
ncbi:AAA family ATPase [Candidatus Woesearchaeota archaeon]|nr:AAA family ATPase [Candidatus Woesearchaeota archaeon]